MESGIGVCCVLVAVVWVVGELVGGLVQGLGGCVCCESGLFVLMAGPVICILCYATTCASWLHPVFKPVALYRYLLLNLYMCEADIANPDLCPAVCRTKIRLNISRFYDEPCQPSRVRMTGLPKKR